MEKSAMTSWLRYPGYDGDMVFSVENPEHPSVNVFARSGVGAIIVAADAWGRKWSDPDFFDRTQATFVGHLRNAVDEDG